MRPVYSIISIVFLGWLAMPQSVFAATKVWTGASGNAWNASANWLPTGVPNSGDEVVFDPSVSNVNCDLPLIAAVNSLHVMPGYSGTILGNNQSWALFTVHGTFKLESGVMDMRKSRVKSMTLLHQTGGSFIKGNGGLATFVNLLIEGGNMNFGNSKVDVLGNFTVSGGQLSMGSGVLTVKGLYQQTAGTFAKPSGNASFESAQGIKILGGTVDLQSSSLTCKGALINEASFLGGSSTINCNGNLSLNASTFDKTSGSLLVNDAFLFSALQSQINLNASVLNCGALDFNETTANLGTGAVWANGHVSINLSVITKPSGALRLAMNDVLEANASSIQTQEGILLVGGLHLNGTQLSLGTGSTWVSGEMNLENESVLSKSGGFIEGAYNHSLLLDHASLLLDNATQINLGSLSASASTIELGASETYINGSVNIQNESVLKAPAGILTVNGNVELSSSAFQHRSGTVCMTGSSNFPYAITGAPLFYNLELRHLENSGIKNIDIFGGCSVINQLIFNNGSSLNRPIVIRTGTISITGDLAIQNYRAQSLPECQGVLLFNGTQNQSITGAPALIQQGVLPSIVLNKTSGQLNLSGCLTLGNGFDKVNGLVSFAPASHLVLDGGSFNLTGITAPELSVSGSVTVLSSLRVNNNLNILPQGHYINQGNGTLICSQNLNNNGRIELRQGTLSLSGDLQNAGDFACNGASVTITGTLIQNSGAFSVNTAQVNANGDVELYDGRLAINAGSINITGDLNQSGGEVEGSYSTNGMLSINGDFTQNSGSYSENSGTLRIGGTLNLEGTFNRSGGKVTFNGTGSQTIPALAYHKLEVTGNGRTITLAAGDIKISAATQGLNCASGNTYIKTDNRIHYDGLGNQDVSGFSYENLILSRGGIKSAVAVSSVKGELSLGNGTTLDADGASNTINFTLLSDSLQTAQITELPSGAAITGNMNVQRWTRGGVRSNRFFGAPVDTAGGIKFTQFKDDILLFGPGNTANGFNQPSVFTSNVWTYQEALPNGTEWRSPASINEVLPVGKGTLVYHVGTPDQAPINSATVPRSAIIDFRGTPNQGTINLPIQCTGVCTEVENGNGWNLLANPYASTIDWMSDQWLRSGVSGTIYIWNPRINQYASFNANNPEAATNGGSRYIAPGQGFFLKATTSNPVLQISERVKTTMFPDSMLFRVAPEENMLKLAVRQLASESADEVVLLFADGAKDAYEEHSDALKFIAPEVAVELALVNNDGIKLASNVVSEPDLTHDQFFNLHLKSAVGQYQIEVDALPQVTKEAAWYWVDRISGTKIKLEEGLKYALALDGTSETYTDRFYLLLSKETNGINTIQPLTVYPNPSSGDGVQAFISDNSMAEIQIMNATGASVMRQTMVPTNGVLHLNTSTLSAGIYTLSVRNDSGIRVSKLVISK